jgi:hypothetical protein
MLNDGTKAHHTFNTMQNGYSPFIRSIRISGYGLLGVIAICCYGSWQLQEENNKTSISAKVGWEIPGSSLFFPRQNCKPSKWQPIYGIRNVLAARRVIPKTVDQVTGMQFFHSEQSFQIS